MNMRRNKRGQGTIEYILIFSAVVAAIMYFSQTFFREKMNNSYESLGTQMETQITSVTFGPDGAVVPPAK